ncbi:MAG: PD40 domain-containing protein [Thermoleophilia bacterium]|nr:PD40 domain-containing protein [Thermoleophilia bacterium]
MSHRAWRVTLACGLALAAGTSGCGGGDPVGSPTQAQALTAAGATHESESEPSAGVSTGAPSPDAPGETAPEETAPEEAPSGEPVLVFASDRDGDFELFRMGLDGSGQEQLTLSTGDDVQPDASTPDGRIAWHSQDGIEILVPGTDRYALSNVWRTGAGFYAPAWSPDGSLIAFVAGDEGLSVAAPDGSVERLVAEGSVFGPTWSPDGRTLAFFERVSGFSRVLGTMGLDGSGARALAEVAVSALSETSADWSPDGVWIAYDCTAEEVGGGGEICVVPASGGEPVNLTRSPGDDRGPEWSPDGATIAFTSERDGNSEIYLMSADGSGQTRLTDDPAMDTDPVWALEPAGGLRTYASESFDDPASGWEQFSGEASSALYEEGSLIIRAGEPSWLATSAAPSSIPDRAAVRLDVRDTGEASDAGFGFLCAYRDIDNHFAAGIGSDGTYAISERRGGETTILTGDGQWAPSEEIEARAASYRIEGECRSWGITLVVDGRWVDTVSVEGGLPEGGAFGVFVETFADGGAEVRFDEIAYAGFPRTVLPSLTRAP